jgi:TRAP-type C4-dicarboxylate transport system permease small subunit
MTAMVTLEVVVRSFLNSSLGFADEVAAYLLVALTFLGVSVSHHENAHFRVGLLYDRIPERTRRWVDLAWDVMALGFAAIVTYYLAQQVYQTFTRGIVSMTMRGLPLYLPQLLMPVGFAIFTLVIAAGLVRRTSAAFGSSKR